MNRYVNFFTLSLKGTSSMSGILIFQGQLNEETRSAFFNPPKMLINIEKCLIRHTTTDHQNPDCSDFDGVNIDGQLFWVASIWIVNSSN